MSRNIAGISFGSHVIFTEVLVKLDCPKFGLYGIGVFVVVKLVSGIVLHYEVFDNCHKVKGCIKTKKSCWHKLSSKQCWSPHFLDWCFGAGERSGLELSQQKCFSCF